MPQRLLGLGLIGISAVLTVVMHETSSQPADTTFYVVQAIFALIGVGGLVLAGVTQWQIRRLKAQDDELRDMSGPGPQSQTGV